MELQGSHQATGRRFALVVSSFNKDITDGLLRGARAVLADAGVTNTDVTVVRVPGAFKSRSPLGVSHGVVATMLSSVSGASSRVRRCVSS